MENPRSGQSGNCNYYAKEEIRSRKRKETIQERRRRILGTASVRFANTADKDTGEDSCSETEYSKRRRQVRRAQRDHRQRTLDYIEDLETEIIRLRGSRKSAREGDSKELCSPSLTDNDGLSIGNMNVSVLVQTFHGQIAPGVCVANDTTVASPCQPPSASERNVSRSSTATSIPLHLELVEPLTKMLFYNFAENVAPTLVVFDGPSNGFRSHILPLAWDNNMVRYALMAASANQLRFKHHQLLPQALTFQSLAIEKLSAVSKAGDPSNDTRVAVFATIILLLITDMMNGGPQFHLLFSMVKSWIDATNCTTISQTQQTHRSEVEIFLLGQLDMVRRYAKPLTIERVAIHDQHYFQTLTAATGTFKDKMTQIFKSLSEAVKHACCIYYYHIMNDAPPPDVEDRLNDLKDITQRIPPYAPGENSLAWVYFIAAAESSVSAKRIYFTKRLMGIFDRGNFSDVTPAFVMLHHTWNCNDFGGSWTKILRGTSFFLATVSST
ncbi:hypothetical protein GQ53DRAFT_870080 [Thozetella sp. PMI_491]|nr:hypothetical protein GQ53DRAFT_870080 [Thozetella sp. PMI_491]